NARTIVADTHFDLVAEISCYRLQPRFKAVAGRTCALGCGVKPVRDQVQKRPGDLLRVDVRNADRRIEIALQRDLETLFSCAGSMVGEVEALVDDRVDLDWPMRARALARMQQHVLDDGVGALAVLHDPSEVVLQRASQLFDFLADLARQCDWLKYL